MRMTDLVAEYIMNVLETCGGHAEIQRNELAEEMGCVPSQINYVLTSRFTPEQGYLGKAAEVEAVISALLELKWIKVPL